MEQSIGKEQRGTAVAGRECGACTVCCSVLPVRADGLRKTANVLCEHCDDGRGCRIYATRPKLCRDFYCQWRLNPDIPSTWRPDKSGIFIQRIPREYIDELPPGLSAEDAIMFMLLRPDAIGRPALADLIAGCIARRVATFLAIPGPPGYLPAQLFLNEAIETAGARDLQTLIRHAVEILRRQEFEPVPDFD